MSELCAFHEEHPLFQQIFKDYPKFKKIFSPLPGHNAHLLKRFLKSLTADVFHLASNTYNWINFPSKIPTVEHLSCRTARWVLLFSVIWTLPDPIGHSNVLILKPDDSVNNFQFSGLKAS